MSTSPGVNGFFGDSNLDVLRGKVVMFCPPHDFTGVALASGYLHRRFERSHLLLDCVLAASSM